MLINRRHFATKAFATLALLSGAVSLTACDKSAEQAPTAPKASSTTSTSTQPKPDNPNQPTYKVSVTSATPPFVFLNDKGTPQGFDIDVMKRVGELEGFNAQFQPSNWNGMFESIDTGKSDMAISGISFTPERNQKYNLSQSYLNNPSAMMFMTGKANFTTLADATGKTIATTDGGKSLTYGQSVKNGTLVTENAPFLMFQKVVTGQADVGIYDKPVLEDIANNHPNYKVTIVALDKPDDPSVQTVIVTSKSKPDLQAKINTALTKMQQQGELDKLKAKWHIK